MTKNGPMNREIKTATNNQINTVSLNGTVVFANFSNTNLSNSQSTFLPEANVETGELRNYHSSQNNARFFYVPHLIRNEEDLERFLDELSRHDMLEFIRQQRPDTK